MWQVFLRVHRLFLVSIIPAVFPTWCCSQNNKRAKPGNIHKAMVFTKSGSVKQFSSFKTFHSVGSDASLMRMRRLLKPCPRTPAYQNSKLVVQRRRLHSRAVQLRRCYVVTYVECVRAFENDIPVSNDMRSECRQMKTLKCVKKL